MANTWYTAGQASVLASEIDWVNDDIRALLVDAQYVFSAAHRSLTAIPPRSRVDAVKIAPRTKSSNACDAGAAAFGGLLRGASAIVVYKHAADDAGTTLLVYIDTATGLPLGPGESALVTWDNAAAKIGNCSSGTVGTPTVTRASADPEWTEYIQNNRNRTAVRPPKRTKTHAKILMCSQNSWYTQPIAGAVYGEDVAISINGVHCSGIGSNAITDTESFLASTEQQIEDRLRNFLTNNLGSGFATSRGVVIMDIEAGTHPSGLWEFSEADQDRLIDAFIRRARAARRLLPRARLGFYGTMAGNGQGEVDEAQTARTTALVRAGQRGMFDIVDVLTPILYGRFGPSDATNLWTSWADYAHLGISSSRQIRRSNGDALPLLPFVTFYIANGNSGDYGKLIADLSGTDPIGRTLGVLFDVVSKMGVREVLFWSGEDEDTITTQSNPNNRTISEHVAGMLA